MSAADSSIEKTLALFSQIYLGGIPSVITNDSAYLSFVCCVTAVDVLAGYRYGEDYKDGKVGTRFTDFVRDYFPEPYGPYASKLYDFRCAIVHAFSPTFPLTHHHSEKHFTKEKDGAVVLNAEDFYSALVFASQRYFTELRSSRDLQSIFLKRLQSRKGGGVMVRSMEEP